MKKENSFLDRILTMGANSSYPEIQIENEEPDEFTLFLEANFSYSRILVVKCNQNNKRFILGKLRLYSNKHKIEFGILDGNLTPNDIRGEDEIILENGVRCIERKHPAYWPKDKKMIVVDGLNDHTEKEVLKSFLYVACLAGTSRGDIPYDKLPDGSGFVFLAEDNFPFNRFESISDYWNEEAKMFSGNIETDTQSELDLLCNYDRLLCNLGIESGKIREKEITTFFPMRGKLYNHELMVVGRAVNGWETKICPGELLDNEKRKEHLDSAYHIEEDVCPLSWVTNAWGGKQYNTKKSAFWRVIHKMLRELGIEHSDENWPSYIVWSNLYKVAPYEGGNPSSQLINIQQVECASILKREVYLFQPKRILFLTGYDWANDILNKINEFQIHKKCHGLAEAKGQFFGEGIKSEVVIAKHPQGKKESALVDEVALLFNS